MDHSRRLAAVLGGVAVLVVVVMSLAGGASGARSTDTREYLRALQTVADLQAHPPAPVPGAVGAPTPAASAAPAPRWKWDLLRPLKAAEAAEAVVMGEEEGVAAATTGREE